jgi:hypothetical protein
MIFNRHWYERNEGRGELDDYRAQLHRLSSSERSELIAFLSARNPAEYARDLGQLPVSLRPVARFYIPLTRDVETEIRVVQRARLRAERTAQINLTSEEIVEDAGLEDDELATPPPVRKRKRAREAA